VLTSGTLHVRIEEAASRGCGVTGEKYSHSSMTERWQIDGSGQTLINGVTRGKVISA